jgi:hypothetical protein
MPETQLLGLSEAKSSNLFELRAIVRLCSKYRKLKLTLTLEFGIKYTLPDFLWS